MTTVETGRYCGEMPRGCRSLAVVAIMLLGLAPSACGRTARPDPADVARGDQFAQTGRHREAADVYRAAVSADPLNGALRRKLAEALWSDQQWADGASEAIRAADLLPDDVDAQMLAASRALSLGRFPEAAARVAPVLQRNPQRVDALIVQGNAIARLQDSTWALYVLRTKARQAATFDAALKEVRPATSAADDARAEASFKRALAIAPDSFDTRVAMLNFLWATRRQAESLPLLRQLADERPGHFVLNLAAGQYLASLSEKADSERYLQRAAASGDRETGVTLAEVYAGEGRLREARAILEPLADEPPGSVSVPLAQIEFRDGAAAAALERVETLLRRIPQHGRALEAKALFLTDLGRTPEAVQAARAAVTAAPTSAEARFILARALEASGAPDDAFTEFTEAVRLDPLHRPAARALASRAIAAGRPELAVELMRPAVRADPADEEAAVTLVSALISQNDSSGAASALDGALSSLPRSAALLTRKGDLNAARDAAAARDHYRRALALNPREAGAVCGLASLELREGHHAAARQRLERALEADPGRAELLLALAATLRASGDLPSAERTYRRLLDKDPAHVVATLAAADLLRELRREAEALTAVKQLVQRRPTAVDARVYLATMLEAAGQVAEAEAEYKRVLAEQPRSSVAAYRLAALQVEHGGNLDVALDLAQRAVQALPDDPEANDVLGWVYVRKKLPRLGVRHLEVSVKAAPDVPRYRYHLGVAYVDSGQRARGRAELARATALSPDSPFAARARTALANAER